VVNREPWDVAENCELALEHISYIDVCSIHSFVYTFCVFFNIKYTFQLINTIYIINAGKYSLCVCVVRPHTSMLGRLPETNIYEDVKAYPVV